MLGRRTSLTSCEPVGRRALGTPDVPPKLTVTEPWLKVFTAFYVLVGIGILVEVARRLGMGFIASRDELAAEKAAEKAREDD